jgi:Fe2+ transport system protein FeoA
MSAKLSEIKNGNCATVTSIMDSSIRLKMMEMGLLPGKAVTVLFRAPFGDPIAIDVNGFILSLRLDEAALILVEEPSLAIA